jgi:predicted short-subunit dehydrogenase-like oxidoreductase (DUF2520 family)
MRPQKKRTVLRQLFVFAGKNPKKPRRRATPSATVKKKCMPQIQKIALIGAGKVATHLAQAFKRLSLEVSCVYSRSLVNAEKLAHQVGAKAQQHLDFSDIEADLFILALTDSALPSILPQLRLPPEAALVHTSGALPLSVLGSLEPKIKVGVFYPLQTFSLEKKVDWKIIPIGIEAKDEALLEALLELGRKLSPRTLQLDSDTRAKLHVAAVFACNFVNHCWAISAQILKEGLDFQILHPLIAETTEKAFVLSPFDAQTGPALRQDKDTLARHLAYLQAHLPPHYAELYRQMTQSIQILYSIAPKNTE